MKKEHDIELECLRAELEILENAEKREIPEPDVELAWKRFQNAYLPMAERNRKTEANFRKCVLDEKSGQKQMKKRKRIFRGVVTVSAAMVLMLLSGMATAYALGHKPQEILLHWTDGKFSMGMEPSETEEMVEQDGCIDVMERYGIPISGVPEWLPDGFYCENRLIGYRSSLAGFVYSDGTGTWTLEILPCNQVYFYEKTEEEVVCHTFEGIPHYVIQRAQGECSIVWVVDGYELALTGDFAMEEAKSILEEMYGI